MSFSRPHYTHSYSNVAYDNDDYDNSRGRDYHVAPSNSYSPREHSVSPIASFAEPVSASSAHISPEQPYGFQPPVPGTHMDRRPHPLPPPPPQHGAMDSDPRYYAAPAQQNRSASAQPTSYTAYRPPTSSTTGSGSRSLLTGAATGGAASAAYETARHEPNDAFSSYGRASPYEAQNYYNNDAVQDPVYPAHAAQQNPFSSNANLVATPPSTASRPSMNRFSTSYSNYPPSRDDNSHRFGDIDPLDVADDDDDPFATPSKRWSRTAYGGAAAGAAAVTAGAAGSKGARDASGSYNQVPGGAADGAEVEKSQWLKQEIRDKRKRKWMVIGLIAGVIVLAVLGGVLGVYFSQRGGGSSSSNADPDAGTSLTKDSPSIKALMGNKNLHKVFPGMDYTPINTQYPDCLKNPPSQNNVTKDVAVLSQLTPELRLYGTDCNQTEMVLHAIDVLDLKNDMSIWLGVWQDGNSTTNDRQLKQLWSILDVADHDLISGVVVGNEVLFSKYMSEEDLAKVMDTVRTELRRRNIQVPVATSDLGSNWTPALTSATDVVMSNIHPFFGGVAAPEAASWTWSFWQDNDVKLTSGTDKKQIISEVGWPSAGGNDCGTGATCTSDTQGSVAGISEMNQFMADWVCQSLANGTSYFWFEAFDEPWKVRYDKGDENWEDKWGLMDVNRNLKSGIKIPDCGGKQAGAARR